MADTNSAWATRLGRPTSNGRRESRLGNRLDRSAEHGRWESYLGNSLSLESAGFAWPMFDRVSHLGTSLVVGRLGRADTNPIWETRSESSGFAWPMSRDAGEPSRPDSDAQPPLATPRGSQERKTTRLLTALDDAIHRGQRGWEACDDPVTAKPYRQGSEMSITGIQPRVDGNVPGAFFMLGRCREDSMRAPPILGGTH